MHKIRLHKERGVVYLHNVMFFYVYRLTTKTTGNGLRKTLANVFLTFSETAQGLYSWYMCVHS